MTVFGDRMNAADDDVWAGTELLHLVALRGDVELCELLSGGPEPAGVVDVLGDVGQSQRLAAGGEDAQVGGKIICCHNYCCHVYY